MAAGNKEQRTRRLVEHLVEIGRWEALSEGENRRLDMTFWTNQQLVFLLERNGMKASGTAKCHPRQARWQPCATEPTHLPKIGIFSFGTAEKQRPCGPASCWSACWSATACKPQVRLALSCKIASHPMRLLVRSRSEGTIFAAGAGSV